MREKWVAMRVPARLSELHTRAEALTFLRHEFKEQLDASIAPII